MSFQWIFDNAASISVNSKPTILSTQSIDGTYRSSSNGSAPWRFEVKLPDGPRWTDYRNIIAIAEGMNSTVSDTIKINNAGYIDWLNPYLGDCTDITDGTCVAGAGNTLTLTNGLATSGYRLRAGDLVQLKSGATLYSVYKVVEDVPAGTNTVKLHRPVIDPAGGYSLVVGPAVSWLVRCSSFPQWTVYARNQISWQGSFVFVEDLT